MATQSTGTTAGQQTTDFHYITTVQTRDGLLNSRSGVLSVPTGSRYTRTTCFNHLMDQLTDEYGTPISVLFFALEPDQL